MRIISLNLWGGRLFDRGLLSFLQREEADIYCFQEVCAITGFHRPPYLYLHYQTDEAHWPNGGGQWLTVPWARVDLLEQLRAVFPHHVAYFASVGKLFLYKCDERYGGMDFGNAMFVRRGAAIDDYRQKFILGEYKLQQGDQEARTAQLVRLRMGDGSYVSVGNMHGTWGGPGGQAESDERRRQAEYYKRFIDSVVIPSDKVVLCGDYNLPRGSIYLREICQQFNLVDLIDVHDVTDTLSSVDAGPSAPEWRCVDHMLVSPSLSNASFRVLNGPDDPVVSDHAPLVLEFD